MNAKSSSNPVEQTSTVTPLPMIKRKRGRRPTRSPRCPVVHLHIPTDPWLMEFKFKIIGLVLKDAKGWARIAIDEGYPDPIAAIQFFLASEYRAAFEDEIEDSLARYWFKSKPTHAEEIAAKEAAK